MATNGFNPYSNYSRAAQQAQYEEMMRRQEAALMRQFEAIQNSLVPVAKNETKTKTLLLLEDV